MRALTLSLKELSEGDLEAWRDLTGRAAEPNPFFEPPFVMAAARRLPAHDLQLWVIAEGNEWLACLPVSSHSVWHRLPARWSTTWRHAYCYLGTPLVDRDRCGPAVAALVEAIRESGPTRLFAFELLGATGPVSDALAAAVTERRIPTVTYERFERAALFRRAEPTYLDETLRPSRRKELRRLERRLGEELGAEIEVREVADDPRAYEEFLRLEGLGWKGREATALNSNTEHAAFFRELCHSFRQEERLQLLSLGTSEHAVAMQCNLLAGDRVFCFKVAYDEAHARYSPGVQLEVRAIEVFHAWPAVSAMDSCADPDNDLVNRLWPDRLRLTTIVVPAKGLACRVLVLGAKASLAVRRRVRAARPRRRDSAAEGQ